MEINAYIYELLTKWELLQRSPFCPALSVSPSLLYSSQGDIEMSLTLLWSSYLSSYPFISLLHPRKTTLSCPLHCSPFLLSWILSQAFSHTVHYCYWAQQRQMSGQVPWFIAILFFLILIFYCYWIFITTFGKVDLSFLLETFFWTFIPFHSSGFPATSPAAPSQYLLPMSDLLILRLISEFLSPAPTTPFSCLLPNDPICTLSFQYHLYNEGSQ